MASQTEPSASSLGGRIAALVARSSVSIEEVAEGMLLDREVGIGQVLDGTYKPSLSELMGAADVLEVPVAVLTGDLPPDGHLGVSLRLGRVDDAESLGEPLAFANRMLEHRVLLDSWLGRVESAVMDGLQRKVSTRTHVKTAGAETADRVRAVLGLADDEAVADLVGLVEALGIPVAFAPLPIGVHGLNVRDLRSGGAERVILVSSSVVWAKQRYTLAHELCHALYDDKDQLIVDRVEVPDAIPEWRAEAFARHLLLPRRAVVAAAHEGGAKPGRWQAVTAGLMVRFGVSRDATVIALQEDGGVPSKELDGVRSANVEAMMREAGLLELWSNFQEAQDAEVGSPTLVARAADAYSRGWVRADLVADLMRVDVPSAERALADAGWQPPAYA